MAEAYVAAKEREYSLGLGQLGFCEKSMRAVYASRSDFDQSAGSIERQRLSRNADGISLLISFTDLVPVGEADCMSARSDRASREATPTRG